MLILKIELFLQKFSHRFGNGKRKQSSPGKKEDNAYYQLTEGDLSATAIINISDKKYPEDDHHNGKGEKNTKNKPEPHSIHKKNNPYLFCVFKAWAASSGVMETT